MMAITPKKISEWEHLYFDDNQVIYRPRIKADYIDNGEHVHTDFYLDRYDCLDHWWYTATWLQDEKENMMEPLKQTFLDYIKELHREVNPVDPFGSIIILEAVANVARLKSIKELL